MVADLPAWFLPRRVGKILAVSLLSGAAILAAK